eukprot:281052_1
MPPLPLPALQVESITVQRLYGLPWNQRTRRRLPHIEISDCRQRMYCIDPNYGFNHHTNAIFSWNDGEVCCAFSQYNFGSSMYGVYQRQYDHGALLIDQRHDDSGFNTIGAERFHAL